MSPSNVEPIKPYVLISLRPGKLPAVLVPRYVLFLKPNHKTGTPSRIAVFTENGAIIMTSESCQSLIEKAIQQGSENHVADQIGGAYVLRQKSTKTLL